MTLALLLTAATGAWAQSTPTEVSTFADLQTALSAGNDVKLTANIQFTSPIEISDSKKITIDGNGKTMSTTSAIRAFKVWSSATVAFKDLTLTGFVSGGGPAINNSGTIVLDGCTISNCHVNNSNGGGAIESSGKLYAINTTFSGNYSGEIGGAINNYGGSLYLSGCTFTNNYTTSSNANFGGAIGNNSSNTVVIVNCTFSGNKYGGSNGSASDLGVFNTPGTYTIAGCTGITIAGATLTTYQYGTATPDYSDLSAISFTYDQSDTPITPVDITWTAATKTVTLTNDMPAGNVTVSVEYFPQATMAEGAVTAATGVKATTEDALVTVDATKLTGAAKMMYYASTEATAPAYDATGWTDQVPTAEKFTEAGNVNVWYYPVGTDVGVGGATATYSDGDMNATALTVTLGAAPLYNAEFDLTNAPEADKADGIWKTDITGDGVVKGTPVTVTYTGSKKVIGVKAEKKAAAVVLTITVAKGSTDLSADKLLYYTPGETYRQAIANHPENKLDGGLGWNIWDGGNDATIFYKESADKARDLSIDGDQHFRPTDSINLDTVIDPTLNFYFVAQF